MKIFGMIMAGGGGERFWPLSRRKKPKQLLDLTGRDVMLNEALHRLEGVCEKNRLFVVTNALQAESVKEVTALPAENVLTEPVGRNTAACIGYAALALKKKYGDGVMIVTPSDAYIRDEEEFARVLSLAAKTAEEENAIVTVGISPTYPATGYGYIRFERGEGEVKKVLRFVEKPDLETAKEYLESKEYLWNSGMFVFKISFFLELFQKFLPKMYVGLQTIAEAIGTEREEDVLNNVYPTLESVSVDYAIMEKTKDILVVEGNFGWSDLGSFEALSAVKTPDERGNLFFGDVAAIDTENCVIHSEKKTVAAIGVKDLIVVETEDALLICPKDRAQDVKKMVELLRSRGREDLL